MERDLTSFERAASYRKHLDTLLDRVAIAEQLAKRSPWLSFVISRLWTEAIWSSTTFRWHPQSGAPPIMGLVFSDGKKGRELFRTLTRQVDHDKAGDELRVSIIEGDVLGQRPGYSVHLGPDPDAIEALGTFEGVVVDHATLLLFGQVNRMYPIPGHPDLLGRFKREYAKHREYMLAPVTRRDDGQLWVHVELGLVKRAIHFRDLKDITEDDVDAAALVLPMLITPRPE